MDSVNHRSDPLARGWVITNRAVSFLDLPIIGGLIEMFRIICPDEKQVFKRYDAPGLFSSHDLKLVGEFTSPGFVLRGGGDFG
jgi:hypothetical protein